VQGPFELAKHEGTASATLDLGAGSFVLFGATTSTAGDCAPPRARCALDVFTDAALPSGWTAWLNRGTFWPGITLDPIPQGPAAWDMAPACGQYAFLQVYVFDGPPLLPGSKLVASEQMTCGCIVCPPE
jgi:hypothetical protein